MTAAIIPLACYACSSFFCSEVWVWLASLGVGVAANVYSYTALLAFVLLTK